MRILLLLFFTFLTFSFNAHARLLEQQTSVQCLEAARAGYISPDSCVDPIDPPQTVYCFPQPSTLNAATTRTNFYYAAGSCTIRILPLTCNSGYTLKNANTPNAACVEQLTLTFCSTQPSTLNSTATQIYLYEPGNCTIKHMPTACASGYTLQNANTPNAACVEAITACTTQPSTSHATAVRTNFYYSAGNCTINSLPTTCESGYALQNANTPSAACSLNICSPQPDQSYKSGTNTHLYTGMGAPCLLHEVIGCQSGYTLTSEAPHLKHCVSSSCPAGQYKSGDTCLTCAAGTYSAAGASSCSACPTGQTSAAGASSCSAITCGAGKYLSGSSCLDCTAGAYSTATSNTCSACPTGQTSAAGASSCSAITCPAGKYLSGSSCLFCDAGYKVNTAQTGCDKIMCATQPSTANVATDKSDVYYSGGACWLNKVPLTCNTGFNLVDPNTYKAACIAVSNCSTQPSTANSTATSSNFYYAAGNCKIITLPTACKTGYSLTQAGTDKAACAKLPNCSTQPSTANSTKTTDTYYSESGRCWILKLPTECKTGYSVQNANTPAAACLKIGSCNPQPLTANSTKVATDDFFVNNCWVTDPYPTECAVGYTLKDPKSDKTRCEKTPNCSTQPVLTGSSKTAENVYDAAGKCWLVETPIECAKEYSLEDKGTSKARCQKAPDCKIRPSVANAAEKETNVYYEKDNCMLPELPKKCHKGFELKYAGTDKARCEEVKTCRRSSTKNVKTFKDDFFYEKKKCLIEKLPTACDDGYTLKYEETDRATCMKERSH
ncbi:MAG: hypothetical protein JXQ74_00590 [Alphaproteobacteria bacterium]|nr:hypothetical protein [Alphaproteobacteria bacterium]